MTFKPCKIALIGMMGSGKTTVAKFLCEKLNCQNFECDKIFEEKYNIKIADFFSRFGEEKFRDFENKILNEIIKNDNFIISTGGGVILNEKNRKILFKKLNNNSNIATFYLKTSSDIIFNRIKKDKTRPLLQVENPKEEIEKLINKREKFYSLSDFEILTDNKKIEKIVEEIIEIYGKNINK